MSIGIDPFLQPTTVAVVGASDQEGKAGNVILRQMLKGEFDVYAVNSKGGSICGLTAYRCVSDLPETPDLAVLSLPAEATPEALEDCVRCGVEAVIVVAGGFGETGDAGRALETRLKHAIRGSRTRLLGPNTLGALVPRLGLDTVFLPADRLKRPGPGSVALISQSGSAIFQGLDTATLYGARISAFVGLGNRADVDENEVLQYFLTDESSASIGLYLESFANPRRFVEICREGTIVKPIVLLKGGRSEAGARAVQLHTGSLAGSHRVLDAALRQMGIVRAYDEEELLDLTRALAYASPLTGRRVAIVADGGGMGVIAADYISSAEKGIGFTLATLQPETKQRLAKIARPYASVHNPIDLTGSVTNNMFDGALQILQDDPGIDAILCCYAHHPAEIDERMTEIVRRWATRGRKPLFVTVMGSEKALEDIRILEAAWVPAFPSIRRAVRAIEALGLRGEFLRSTERDSTAEDRVHPVSSTSSAKSSLGDAPTEDRVKALLRERGIAVPSFMVLPAGHMPGEIPLSYPLVLKIRSAQVLHKTELNGVVLGIRNRQELDSAIGDMRARFAGEDLLIEEMEAPGVEIIVGLIDDPTFGLSIMCGAGGVLAELYQDVSFRLLPIHRQDAASMLNDLKAHRLFEGFRGLKVNRRAVIDLLLKVSELGRELTGSLDQLDLNPVIVRADAAVVVDAKLIWKHPVSS